jgi:hypothetical protein
VRERREGGKEEEGEKVQRAGKRRKGWCKSKKG